MASEESENIEIKRGSKADNESSSDRRQLSQAVENANLMLMHASEQGLEIEADLIEKVVKAKYLERENAWTQAEEADFWRVFRDIAQAIQPVTIDSIKAANEKTSSVSWFERLLGIKKNRTLTRKSVQRYIRWALLSLAVMLIIQIYLSVGNTILTAIDQYDLEIKRIEGEIANKGLSDIQKNALELEKDVVADKREKNLELLAKWLRPIDYMLLNKPADLSDFRLGKSTREQNREVYERINDLGIRVTQSAKHPILVIGSYILPLFYGLLGAYAYVLRVLFEDIRTITYSLDSDIRYILRINLGALAGLTVGLLNIGSGGGLNLSPLALAFIAGYSIEFVFTAIDRFIGGITKPKTIERVPGDQTR